MKKIIKQLITKLTLLTPPYNPVTLKEIFDLYPQLETASIPTNIQAHSESLLTLKKLVEAYFNLARADLQHQKIQSFQTKENSLQTKITELQEKVRRGTEDLNAIFLKIIPQLNEFLRTNNTSVPQYTALTDIETPKMVAAVKQYTQDLNATKRELDSRAAKLTVIQLKRKIQELMGIISSLKVVCSPEDSVDRFKGKIFSVNLIIKQLTEIEPKANELHKKLAELIRVNEIQLKTKSIDTELAAVKIELETIQLELNIHTLDITLKGILSKQFSESTNVTDLITSYKNKVESVWSYLNVYSWKSYIQDSKTYTDEQKKAQASVSYLELLQTQKNRQKHIQTLETNKNGLVTLPLGTPNSTDVDQAINQLIEQAKILLKECPLLTLPSYITSSTSALDFNKTLADLTSTIPEKLQHNKVVLAKLNDLSDTEEQLDNFRTQFNLLATNDSHLPSEDELRIQIGERASKNSTRESVTQQLDLCNSFNGQATHLEQLTKQYNDFTLEKQSLGAKLSDALVQVSQQDQTKTFSEQLAVLQAKTVDTFATIKQLPLLNDIDDAEEVAPLDVLVQPLVPLVPNSQNKEPSTSPSIVTATLAEITNTTVLQTLDPTKQPQQSIESISAAMPSVTDPQKLSTVVALTSEKLHPLIPKPLSSEEIQKRQPGPVTLLSSNAIQSPKVLQQNPSKSISSEDEIVTHPLNIVDLHPDDETDAELSASDSNMDEVDATIIEGSPRQEPMGAFDIFDTWIAHPTIEASGSTVKQPGTPESSTHSPVSSPLLDSVENRKEDHADQSLLGRSGIVPAQLQSDELSDSSEQTPVHPTEVTASLDPDQAELIILVSPSSVPMVFDKQLQKDELSDPSLLLSPTLVKQNDSDEDEQPINTASPVSPPLELSPTRTVDKPGLTLNLSAQVATELTLPSPQTPTECQKRKAWHGEILLLLAMHPAEIQDWYQNIYSACELYVKDNPSSFQPSQLIRDILFELQHKTNLSVISTYMRLCPNPSKDLNNLLILKPNLPLLNNPFDQATILQDSPPEFKPLYAQYLKLKKDYPVEGALLLQAIQSLHLAKELLDDPNSSITANQIPRISQDPRYESLKRHRGFFKVWEAIEDFFRLIIGKIKGQTDYEYTNKPCFFRTKTTQLIEEADLKVQKDLQSMSVD
jgi:hypothetical protein